MPVASVRGGVEDEHLGHEGLGVAGAGAGGAGARVVRPPLAPAEEPHVRLPVLPVHGGVDDGVDAGGHPGQDGSHHVHGGQPGMEETV